MTRAAEFKPGSVAAHWRGCGGGDDELRRKILQGWLQVAEEYQLELLDFDGGVEIRVPGHDKGQAVETILHETEGIASVAYWAMIRRMKMHFRRSRERDWRYWCGSMCARRRRMSG